MTKVIGNLFRYIRVSFAQREAMSLSLLVLSALVLRLLLIGGFQTYEFASVWMVDSEVGRLAQSLASGQGFAFDGQPTVWRGPLYPFVLSLVFRACGIFTTSSAVVILILLSIVSSLTIMPVYYIGKRLFNREVGFISGLLWAFHPGAIRYSAWIISESSFVALSLVLIILLFLRLRDSQTQALGSFLCGLVTALALLTRPVALAFVPFAFVWLLWNVEIKRALRQIALITTTMIVILAPWTVRNYLVFHQFIPISGSFGLNFWYGNRTYLVEGGRQLSKEEAAYLKSLNEVELGNVMQDKAVDFIKNNPGTFIRYTLHRIYQFWTITFQGDRGKVPLLGEAAPMVLWMMNLVIVMLTVLGIVLSWKQWRQTTLLLFLLLTFPLPHYLTVANEYRYHFPLEGIMCIFVAYSIVSIVSWSMENGRGHTDGVAAGPLSRATSRKANLGALEA